MIKDSGLLVASLQSAGPQTADSLERTISMEASTKMREMKKSKTATTTSAHEFI